MRKRGLLQHALAGTIASMGHTDLLVIADAGLPIPPGVTCIDLAVRCGLPPMLDVTGAVADELQVEEIVVAEELVERDEGLSSALRELFPDARFRSVSHDELKRLSAQARAVVRTGECTPYHNVILVSGVTF
jgi:D-ribose pyranase